MNAIDTGIYNAMHGNVALLAGVTGIFNMRAPEGMAFPYITFFEVNGNRTRAFNDVVFDDCLYQIDIWAATNAAAGTVLDLLVTALDGVSLTITGYSAIYCKLENLQKLYEDDVSVNRIMSEWRVMTQK